MALYEDGKIKFDDAFIEQFNSNDVREFLKIIRSNLVNRKNSPYCTVEHLLYNWSSKQLEKELFWYLLGKSNTTSKSYTKMSVRAMSESYEVLNKLREIEKQMTIENNWDE